MAAPEKLHALLEIVRLTVMREGVSVSELSETLHISAKKIRETIALLSVIGVPPYRPDQLLDIYVDDDDMVYCDMDQGLALRPTLTDEECEALALALHWTVPHSREVLEDLLNALPKGLRRSVETVLLGFEPNLEEDALKSVAQIQKAIEGRDRIRLTYFSESRQLESNYDIEPWRIVHFDTGQYLWGGIRDSGEGRLFKLDRIRGVTFIEDDRSAWHPPLDVPSSARPKDVHYIELQLLVNTPSVVDYVRDLGGHSEHGVWRLPFASDAWVLSRLQELTGKIRVTAPPEMVERYQGWLLETLGSYDS